MRSTQPRRRLRNSRCVPGRESSRPAHRTGKRAVWAMPLFFRAYGRAAFVCGVFVGNMRGDWEYAGVTENCVVSCLSCVKGRLRLSCAVPVDSTGCGFCVWRRWIRRLRLLRVVSVDSTGAAFVCGAGGSTGADSGGGTGIGGFSGTALRRGGAGDRRADWKNPGEMFAFPKVACYLCFRFVRGPGIFPEGAVPERN